MSPRPASGRRPPLPAIGLAALAVAAATWAQSLAAARPWTSLGAFAVAALLFALAVRGAPREPEAALPPPPARARPFHLLLTLGVLICAGCGAATYLWLPRPPTHVAWAIGLLVLAASALVADARGRATPRADAPRRDLLAIAALLAVCAVVFGWDLAALPREVHGDDAEVALDAVRLLQRFDLFAAGWFELPRFHALPTAIGLQLFGVNLLGLRVTSAVLGTLTVLLTFAVGRRLWNAEVGFVAALLLATQRFFIHLSRAGYHYVDTPLLSILVVWLFLRLWQDRKLGAGVWCGIALGLGVQTYYASRLVPVLFVLTWLLWMRGDGAPRPAGTARSWRARLELLGLVTLVALAVAAPTMGYFVHDWDALWKRTADTSMFSAGGRAHLAHGYGTDSLAMILLIQLRAAFGLFNATPDNSVQYGFVGPLFDPLSAALFVLGAAALIARLAERRVQLIAVWTLLPLVAGAALTVDAPFYPRISGILPFAVLLVAVALHTLLHLARAAAAGRAGRWPAAVLGLAALAAIAVDNLGSYFVDYAPRYRHSPSVEIAAFVRRHGAGKTTFMVGGAPGFYIRHGAIALLTHGYATRDVDDLERFLAAGSPDPAHSLFIVMPQGVHLIPRLEQAVGPLALQTHRNARGDVAFLTATPATGGEPPDPPALLQQANQPGPGGRRLDRIRTALTPAARGLALAAGAVALGLAGVGWRRRRRPGARALAVPLAERVARWRTRLAGPDADERRAAPPAAVVVAALLLVLAVGLALRVVQLAELPAGFFCDEAGNGFNAYSLWLSGRDEAGARWPLYVWSFGVSYKNPIFVYSAIVPMAMLGPTELAVRVTAALYGSATVLAMFFLGRALMGAWVGLLAALLLAVLPWHLHFSRIGFELITFPFFFVLACTCLVRWTQGRRTLARAAVLFGLCLYTYVPAKLIVPLFLAGVAALYRRELWARRRETALALALLVVTALPVAIFDLAHREQSGSYFRHTTLLARDEPPRELVREFGENYLAFFSSEFLFEASNDRIIRHSVGDHGQLYPLLLPLLASGALAALLRRDRAMRLPLLWLALYPVAPALMNEIPSASRGFIGAPAFALLAAIGAGAILRLAGRLAWRSGGRAGSWIVQALLVAGLLAALVPAVRAYWVLYRDEYPLYSAKHYTGFQYGHRQVLDYFRRHYDEYDLLLLTTRRSNQPETFLRFYDGLRQPERTGAAPPFEHREKMRSGSAEAYAHYADGRRRMLFAVLPEEVPLFADAEIKGRVQAPDGSAAFVLVEASALKDFISTWRVFGRLPEHDRSSPPTWTPEAPPRPRTDEPRWRLTRQPFAGVGLNDLFAQNADHACAWAINFVTTEQEREVRVYAGFDDRGEVWVNGTRVPLQRAGGDETTLVDAETGLAHLSAGRNTVAVRVCESVGDWRFYFRVENPDGSPAQGLVWTYRPIREG